jgi:transcription elongation factor GreA
MKKELEYMIKVERKNITQQIAEARDKGDLSENAEYDAAKEAQGMLEMKISILQDKIMNARILDESNITTETISIMNTVKIKNLSNNQIITYTIVPETEANIKEGKISVKTPIAKGLLAKKVGEIANVETPSGVLKFEVLEISI